MKSEEPRRETIWGSEAAYFDAQAAAMLQRADAGLAPAILERYRHNERPWHSKEYRLRLLGALTGKRVLDVGCGMGENAVLLASRGARVTGIDVSRRSIEYAQRLARASRIAVPPEFVCAPLEVADLPARSFDVIWGDGVLHHLLHDLDGVLARLVDLAKEGAIFLFAEPVDRVPGLRAIRKLLPVPPDGTPGERPLREAEIALVRRHVPGLRVKPFAFLSRLNRLLVGNRLEDAPPLRRAIAEALVRLDATLLSAPGASRLGGICVLHGVIRHPR